MTILPETLQTLTFQVIGPERSIVMKPKPSTQELNAWTTAFYPSATSAGGLAGKGTRSSSVPEKPVTNSLGCGLEKLTCSHT